MMRMNGDQACPKWKRAFRKIANVLNEIAGVPNYERYLEHFRKAHPDETPLTEAEFHRRAIDEKYGGGSIRRCC
ncbi:YbdD/YjiX family protein [Thermoactinomyces daqus]|nr:YbdD/YjiX family protein [Thermoactinomyces daqus]